MKFENNLNKNVKNGFEIVEDGGGAFAKVAMVDGASYAVKFEITSQGWGHATLKRINMMTWQMDDVWEMLAFDLDTLDKIYIHDDVLRIIGKIINARMIEG